MYQYAKPKVVTYDQLLEFIEIIDYIDLGTSPIDELNKIKKELDGKLDLNVTLNGYSVEAIAEVFYSFLDVKKAIDFNEILYRSYRIISNHDFVVSSLANKFYEISVDEFQDTNVFQYEILKAINAKGRCTFFMVGDEKQKIFRFAGAIENAFTKASADFGTPIKVLGYTYRSTNNIVNAYSALFVHHPVLINHSKYKDEDISVITTQTDENTHGPTILAYVEKFIKCNVELSEIAILSQSWMDAVNVSKFLRHKYRVVGVGALPHKANHSSTFALLRAVSKFNHSTSIRNLRVVKRNIDLHCLENDISLNEKELVGAANSLISRITEADKTINIIEGLALLKEIFDPIFKISHDAFIEISNLINTTEGEKWTLGKYLETVSGVDGITVTTIHQAKGLEYDLVILNNMNEGKIPYQAWNGTLRRREPLLPENEDDGRTLFYVGVSRAKSALVVLHNWKPSMFVSYVKGK